MRFRSLLFAATILAGSSASAQNSSRLIGSSLYKHLQGGYKLQDSSRYTYTGGRGSHIWYPISFLFNYGVIKYDSCVRIHGTGAVLDTLWSAQQFNSNNNIATSTYYRFIKTTGQRTPYYRYVYHYNAANNIDSTVYELMQTTWQPLTLVVNKYNNANRNIGNDAYGYNQSTGTIDHTGRDSMAYDANGNLLYKRAQVYQQASGTFATSYEETYTYDAQGRVAEMLFNKTKTTYTYHNNNVIQEMTNWDANANQWVNYQKIIITNNAAGSPVEVIYQSWNQTAGSYSDAQKKEVTYNSHNQTASALTFLRDTNGWTTPAYENRQFYYETFTTSVPSTNAAADFKMYPSPALNFIQVEANWKEAAPIKAAIYDMTGRMVKQWNDSPTRQYKRTVITNDFVPGNYIIRLNCGSEGVVQQFMILR